jgi:hypothetical protein
MVMLPEQHYVYVGFEVSTAVVMKSIIFWDMLVLAELFLRP